MKLKLNLNTNDIENMISFLGIGANSKVPIDGFVKSFFSQSESR
jgi:hypothetical protein